MKAISAGDIQTILDTDLVWRRKEISYLVTSIRSSDSTTQRSLIRAGVPMLYAHWEGFGKECFVRYLEFVSYRRATFKSLDPAFLYLASLPSLSNISNMGVKQALDTVQAFISRTNAINKDHFRGRIKTRSNLRSDVLEELLLSCGLRLFDVEFNSEFIDKELCDARNEIAHGSGSSPTLETFLRRRERTFQLMTALQTTVVNAAVTEAYKASP